MAARGVVALGSVSGNVTLDASRGSVFLATLVGNVVLSVRNVLVPNSVVVSLTQDGLGSRTVAWNGSGGQTVTGFTTVTSTAGATSTFVLYSTANDNSTVYSAVNPSAGGGGGSVTSSWEQLLVTGSDLSQKATVALAGGFGLTADLALSNTFTVGPMVHNATLAFTNIRKGHTYTFTYYQASAGEVAFQITSFTPTPVIGTQLTMTNDITSTIGGSSVRVYYSDDGINLRIVGGNDFDS